MVRTVTVLMFCALFMFPRPAAAYVDPGLGGQLFQAAYLIVIGVAGFLIAPSLLCSRTLMRLVRRLLRRRGVRPPGVPPVILTRDRS